MITPASTPEMGRNFKMVFDFTEEELRAIRHHYNGDGKPASRKECQVWIGGLVRATLDILVSEWECSEP